MLSFADMFALIKQIHTSERGVTVMEYGIILSAVIIAIAAILKTIGAKIGNTFNTVGSNLG